MNTTTKTILIGGAIITTSFANTATADITYTGSLGSWNDPNQYTFAAEGESSFSWNTVEDGYPIAVSGNENGFSGFSYSPWWDVTTLWFTSDVDVDWTFLIVDQNGGSVPNMPMIDEHGIDYTLAHGDTFTLDAGRRYRFTGPLTAADSFSFGTVPAPSALALLGLSGAFGGATRKRRS